MSRTKEERLHYTKRKQNQRMRTANRCSYFIDRDNETANEIEREIYPARCKGSFRKSPVFSSPRIKGGSHLSAKQKKARRHPPNNKFPKKQKFVECVKLVTGEVQCNIIDSDEPIFEQPYPEQEYHPVSAHEASDWSWEDYYLNEFIEEERLKREIEEEQYESSQRDYWMDYENYDD